MINVLFVCHGMIDVSADKLCNSTISHDMINRGPGAYSGIVFIGKIKNAIKSIVDY